MMKRLLTITAIFIFGFSSVITAQVTIGYMDTQQVLSELPERENVETQLNTFIQQKQQELQNRSTQFQDEVAKYQANQASLSPSQIETREAALAEMQTSLEEFNQSIRQQIEQKREELLAPIFTRIDEAISLIAEAEELDFVLNRTTNSGNNIIFYASGNQRDITQQVLNELK